MDYASILTPTERKKMSFQRGEQKKCYKCGEKFYLPRTRTETYVYKKKTSGSYGRAKYFCCYSCYMGKEKGLR